MARTMAVLALILAAGCALSSAELVMKSFDLEWHQDRRSAIEEVGPGASVYTTTLCQPGVLGSVAACYNASIKAVGNVDYLPGSPEITFPTDGAPWGVHLTGPYSDSVTYLLSWYTGKPTVGPDASLTVPDTSSLASQVRLSTKKSGAWKDIRRGQVITYKRSYTAASGNSDYSYLSANINHVLLKNLKPGTTYYYQLWSTVSKSWSPKLYSFTTVRLGYPIRVGLIADVGQTANSTATRDHLIGNNPDVVIHVADYSYADNYNAANWTVPLGGNGTNQNRWDSWSVLWEPLAKSVPWLGAAGNHEIEGSGIASVINYTTTSFSYPTNYPFQSYSARHPAPGVTGKWGDINQNLYYSTVIGGQIKLITMNNYIPFHQGTPQYNWALNEFKSVDRKKTPWLIVQFHAPPYHTYFVHYKEQECFMSIWEDIFYKYGVDLVFNGHVHAYERTRPIYKYKIDTCGPMYITIGDGGNVEGPYRNFVDEINPYTNTTYCQLLTTGGFTPNQLQANNTAGWGPGYQRQAHPPNCPTLSWQPAYNVGKGGVLVPKDGDPTLGFCQSSQPLWSAHRDPSFGHGILEVKSATRAIFSWYRNIDNQPQIRDQAKLKRKVCTPAQRRRMMSAHRAML